MPRDSSGVYTLPLPPVVANNDILASFENTTDSDLASEITQSLDRSGRGGMLAPFKIFDGGASTPGLSFTLEPNTGFFRKAPNVIALSVGGTEVASWSTSGPAVATALKLIDGTMAAPGLTFNAESNSGMYRKASGQLAYAIGGADIFTIDSTGIVLASGKTITGLPTGGPSIPDPLTIGTINVGTLNVSGRINANGGITFGAGQTLTGLAALGLSGALSSGSVSTGAATVTSVNAASVLPFTLSSAEVGRFTPQGFLKVSPNGTYYSSTGQYHEMDSNVNGQTVAAIGHSGSNPFGATVGYGATPNDAGHSFLVGLDTAATVVRIDLMSNGGVRHYSANDVNLSDASLKHKFAELDLYSLWNAHRDVRWCAFKYRDQTHDDYNIGYVAQDIEERFATSAPWLVEEMQVGKGKHRRKFKYVYESDLQNIAHALLSECQRRIERLEAQVARP